MAVASGVPSSQTAVPAWAEGYFLSAVKRNGQALEARMLVDQIFSGAPDAMIAVAGDPLQDITELERVLAVIKNGEVIFNRR